jgi:hypothetical protein
MEMKRKLMTRHEIVLISTVVLVGIVLRLIQSSQPLVDLWSWRQTETAMIAENFYRHGFNILYPEISWAGNSGFVGIEFQLITLIAAVLYIFFGIQDWVGRCISVFFFAASVPFLYLLVRKVWNERSAVFAIGIYVLVPLSIFASRSFMPDMASLSLSIMALYLFAEWLEQERNLWLFAGTCAATSLAILVKLPAIIIALPFLYMAWERHGARLFRTRGLWALAALSLLCPLIWYAHAYLISISIPPYFFFGGRGLKLVSLDRYMKILHLTVTSSLTPLVSAAMLVGIVLRPPGKFSRVFHWWLLAIILWVFFAGRGNRHQWYQLPLVPVAAVFAGSALDFALRRLKPSSKPLLFILGCVFFATLSYLSYHYVKPLYRPWGIPSLHAGSELDRLASPNVLVMAANNGDPTPLYYSRRRGWHFPQASNLPWPWPWPTDGREAINELEHLRAEGGSYLILTKYTFYLLGGKYSEFQKHLDSLYQRVRDTDEYIIFDLTGGERSREHAPSLHLGPVRP